MQRPRQALGVEDDLDDQAPVRDISIGIEVLKMLAQLVLQQVRRLRAPFASLFQ